VLDIDGISAIFDRHTPHSRRFKKRLFKRFLIIHMPAAAWNIEYFLLFSAPPGAENNKKK
jgi:hypothetical protein